MPENLNVFNSLTDITIAIVLAIITGFIGYLYGKSQLKYKTKLEFKKRQLSEFYSPIRTRLKRIRALGEFKETISQKSDKVWKEICKRIKDPFEEHKKFFEPFKKSIDNGNKRLKEEIIPLYEEMLDIFQNKFELAKPSTQRWYNDFLNFVEIWHGWLNETIPLEVLVELKHSEETLKPFYDDLENNFNKLQKELAGK